MTKGWLTEGTRSNHGQPDTRRRTDTGHGKPSLSVRPVLPQESSSRGNDRRLAKGLSRSSRRAPRSPTGFFDLFHTVPMSGYPRAIQGARRLMESSRRCPAWDPRAPSARPRSVNPGNAPGWCRPFSADDVRDAVAQGVATGWHEAARLGCRALGRTALGDMPSRNHAPQGMNQAHPPRTSRNPSRESALPPGCDPLAARAMAWSWSRP